jgi:pimeloyl-ACP methyl ester carboxylesterase
LHLIGHFFGGGSAANFAMRHPQRIASLTLWESIFVFAGLRWQMYVATLPSALAFLPGSWRRKGLESIGGAKDDEASESEYGVPLGSKRECPPQKWAGQHGELIQVRLADAAHSAHPTVVLATAIAVQRVPSVMNPFDTTKR